MIAGEPVPTLSAKGVVKSYGATRALADGNLVVHRGSAHALVGRNGAGKSTLVSIVTGLEKADAGVIEIDGAAVPAVADRAGWNRLVSCVRQRPSSVAESTVAENLFLNEQPLNRWGLVDWRRMNALAREELERWEIPLRETMRVGDLSLEQRRVIEIARALRRKTSLVVLDEPTAELEGPGIERLLGMLDQLRRQGATFLYISHHLEEMYRICDSVTILRNGATVAQGSLSEFDEPRVIEAMVGENVSAVQERPARAEVRGATPLDVRGLRATAHDASFDLVVGPGEIVGLAGQAASGAFELGQALAGLRRPVAGTVEVRGRTADLRTVAAAIRSGIAYVPQDRHYNGFVPEMSVAENLTMTVAGRLGRWGFVSGRRRDALARGLVDSCGVVTAGIGATVDSLSGGNQQKVVVGRALAAAPAVMILERPTQGVDVASRDALLRRVEQFVAEGNGAVIVSDELDELRYCDRIAVMVHGAVTEHLAAGWLDADLIAAIEGITPSTTSEETP
jgi:simple sugar transport system ATP-binding protein